MPQMPGYSTSNRPYKIKKTDSAATVPNRVTFPQGTYVNPSTSLTPRLPYQQAAGTQASGLSGVYGAPSAMYPVYGPPKPAFQPGAYAGQGTYIGGTYANTPTIAPQTNYGYNVNQRGRGYGAPSPASPSNIYAPLGVPFSQLPRPGFAALPQLPSGTPALPTATQTLAPGQYMTATGDVKRGAAPFGTNAFGERLDASGNVWNPETATRDIYGGKFIQPGQTKWERNKAGRLVKVQYGKNGQKRIIRGGKNQSAKRIAQRNAQQQQQQVSSSYGGSVQQRLAQQTAPVLDNSTASAFVSFRA